MSTLFAILVYLFLIGCGITVGILLHLIFQILVLARDLLQKEIEKDG